MPLSGSILTYIEDHSLLFDAKLCAGVGLVHRLERVEVNTRRNDMDVTGGRFVVSDYVLSLLVGGDDDAVSDGHDMPFDVLTELGLALPGPGSHLGLGQCVERRDVRSAPLPAQSRADHAGQPVVAVDQVVAGLLVPLKAVQPVKEAGDV